QKRKAAMKKGLRLFLGAGAVAVGTLVLGALSRRGPTLRSARNEFWRGAQTLQDPMNLKVQGLWRRADVNPSTAARGPAYPAGFAAALQDDELFISDAPYEYLSLFKRDGAR